MKSQRVNLTFHSFAHCHICYPVLLLQADVRQPPLLQNSPGVCVWLTPDVPASFVTVEIQLATALSLVSADPYVMLKKAFDQQWAGEHLSHLFSQQTKIRGNQTTNTIIWNTTKLVYRVAWMIQEDGLWKPPLSGLLVFFLS